MAAHNVQNGSSPDVSPVFEPTFLNIEYFFNRVLEFFINLDDAAYSITGGTYFIPELKFIFSLITLFAITVIAYAIIRLWELRQADKEIYYVATHAYSEEEQKNERWQLVQKHLNADSPTEWRMAIIEADSMLDELVGRLGYEGDSLGERLKAADPADFQTLQNAWEAHKVRNKIAHEGASFLVSQREARRIVDLYRTVFEEFNFI